MSVTPPSNANPTGGEPSSATALPLSFEDKLQLFWQKNRVAVLAICVLIPVVLIGKGVWDRMQRAEELKVQAEFQAANTTDKRRAFISAHSNHSLAAVAELELADEAYKSNRLADAITGYEKAIAALKEGPLVARATIGRALSKIQSGKAAEGIAELKALAQNDKQFKIARAEATYHLASLALENGNGQELATYVQQLMQIDPSSIWARRGMMLQASAPRNLSPLAPAPAAAGASAPAAEKQDGPNVQIKLPAK